MGGCGVVRRFSVLRPHLQVEIICDFSSKLEVMLHHDSIDLAIITRSEGSNSGELLRVEAQLWCAMAGYFPEANAVLPLSLFADSCRARPRILQALDNALVSWRVISSSSHLPGVMHPVRSGSAVTVLPASVIPNGWRILGEEQNLPALPALELALMVPENARLSTRRLAHFVREHFQSAAAAVAMGA